jgi:uncharacterized protein with NAD-binding domain and iron-sulfur cluster
MRIAIIGGGTAGLTTAYLLHEAHEVTLFEREAHLGGNVRTLNGNVPCDALESGVCENGVLGFHRVHYPVTMRLLEHLGAEARPHFGSAGYFYADGFHVLLPSPQLFRDEGVTTALRHAGRYLRCSGVGSVLRLFLTYGRARRLDRLAARPLRPFLPPPESRLGKSLRAAIMLSLSTP